MTMARYAKTIAAIAKKYPHATVVYAIDSEGNDYHEVNFPPTPGLFTVVKNDNNIFDSEVDVEDINAVCIN